VDVAGFLARVSPFDTLEPAVLERAARGVRIEFFPAGSTILRQGGDPAEHLYIVRRGEVEVLDGDRLLDLLGDGEVFGDLSLFTGLGPTATIRAREDTLCYVIGLETARATFGTPGGLAFSYAALRRRLVRREESEPVDRSLVRVGSLIRRPPLLCEPDQSVRDAAIRMAAERVSCLLVPRPDGIGILTDRDLRSRVIAEGRSGDTRVGEVMTFPASVVADTSTAGEVLLAMLEGGFHHFPVVDAGGRLVGVVTDTDLMGLERQSPFALKSSVARARNPEEVAAAGRRVPDMVASLVDASADPVDVGHCVALITDAMTVRLIELAIEDIGPAPARWAWLAMGSQARREQALRTDQDHAIAIEHDDPVPEHVAGWFAELGERVTAGLEAAGIARCTGGAMAANPAMRRTLDGWLRAYDDWVRDTGAGGSILSSIVFDYRRVAGDLEVEAPLDDVVRRAKDSPLFLRHLSRRALDLRPPTGFFRHFVVEAKGEHTGKLDLKYGGLVIIGELARAWAVEIGSAIKETLGRIEAAAAAGRIDEETRTGLEESFRLLWKLRLREHVRAHRAGAPPEDFVEPGKLGELTRRELKEAFRIISNAQRELATELGVRSP
jgi:CBS domain-containing protein